VQATREVKKEVEKDAKQAAQAAKGAAKEVVKDAPRPAQKVRAADSAQAPLICVQAQFVNIPGIGSR
jgi:hypothetical protein